MKTDIRRRSLFWLQESIKIAEKDEEVADTYSSTMRDINNDSPEKAEQFMRAFKDAFDNAIDGDVDDHREIALLEAKQAISSVATPKLVSFAQAIMSTQKTPDEVGAALARIIKILLKRVPHANALDNMRNKISMLNPTEISVTTLPDTAAYGQSITLIKTLLNGYSAEYVRQVLSTTAKNLY